MKNFGFSHDANKLLTKMEAECHVVLLSFSLVFVFSTRGRCLTFTSARVFFKLIYGPSCQPTDTKNHTQRSPCSDSPVARVATACVSSPRDRAVSISSHVQQDMVTSVAPPRVGAPCSFVRTVHGRKTWIHQHWR